jgi:hypothetical protein
VLTKGSPGNGSVPGPNQPRYTEKAMTLGDQQVPGGEHLLWVDEH